MAVQWQFVAHDDGSSEHWTWRCMTVDGSIERISEPQSDFGKAVLDAAQHGFRPKSHAYVVISRGWVTHYRPHGGPAPIPPDSAAGAIARRDALRTRRKEGKKGGKPPAGLRKLPGKKATRQGHE